MMIENIILHLEKINKQDYPIAGGYVIARASYLLIRLHFDYTRFKSGFKTRFQTFNICEIYLLSVTRCKALHLVPAQIEFCSAELNVFFLNPCSVKSNGNQVRTFCAMALKIKSTSAHLWRARGRHVVLYSAQRRCSAFFHLTLMNHLFPEIQMEMNNR